MRPLASLVAFVVQAAVLVVVWAVAAPLAVLLGLAGWAVIRGTYEENFRWGEAVLQRARGINEALARALWKIV